jgi:hypothetical protein
MARKIFMRLDLDVNGPLHGMMVRRNSVERDLVLATPHLESGIMVEFRGTIAAYGLGEDQLLGDPLVREPAIVQEDTHISPGR